MSYGEGIVGIRRSRRYGTLWFVDAAGKRVLRVGASMPCGWLREFALSYFNSNAMFDRLKRKTSSITHYDGGRRIVVPITYGEE